jgi:hypothetical protein
MVARELVLQPWVEQLDTNVIIGLLLENLEVAGSSPARSKQNFYNLKIHLLEDFNFAS